MKIVIALVLFVVCNMTDGTVTDDTDTELLRVIPNYNPFWVLEDTAFTVHCEKEAPTRVPLRWNVNGMDSKSLEMAGFTIRNSTVRAEGSGRVRMISKLSKKLTVADSDAFGPAFVFCETVLKKDQPEDQKEEVFISVHLFSVFTEHPNISEGDDVSLKCSPDYEDAKVLWSRDGRAVNNNSERRDLEDGNRTLIIRNSRPQDAGVYQCTVRISAGLEALTAKPLEQSFTKDVRVSGKPYLQKEAPAQVDGSINGTLTLTCPVAAFPLPEVYWLRGDDSPVEPSSRVTFAPYDGVTDARLTISSVTKQDFGVYECVAHNSVGRLVKEFKVVTAGGSSSVLARSVDLARVPLLALCACVVARCYGI